MNEEKEILYISINKNLIDKPPKHILAAANKEFESVTVTRKEFETYINEGYAYSSQFNGDRKGSNFSRSSMIALDFDGNKPLSEILSDDFVKKYAAIVHTTPSHGKNNQDRFRVIFLLQYPIKVKEAYEQLILKLLKYFPEADPACKDAARFFFGCKQSIQARFNGYLNDDALKILVPNFKDQQISIEINSRQESSPAKDCQVTKEEVREMLKFIPTQPGYETWRNMNFAIANEFGDTAKHLIIEWSPDHDKGKTIDKLFEKADGRITIGTLIQEAQKHGYKRKRSFESIAQNKLLLTHCQVALEEVFFHGKDYACFGADLHKYLNGYYQKTSDRENYKLLTDFFNNYPTGLNDGRIEYKFATAKKVKEALDYVKMNCFIDAKYINPPGINLRNGYLRLTYEEIDQSRYKKPKFELLKHSPGNYFTFLSDCEYRPDCDSSVFDNAMEDMLPLEERNTILKVLASSLDLLEIRRVHDRDVKALFLLGQGSNGKDTLRVWLDMLFGSEGVTGVGVGSFKKHDNGGNAYELHSLVSSKVNWASENKQILIDQCQSLKNFCTGDPMMVRQVYCQPTELIPKAISLFNVNEIPNIKSNNAAMDSRISIINFKNSFSTNPKEGEKLANPRLKHDKQFIENNILPAFLNRLIEAFYDVYKNGINYDFNESLMNTIREDNNHLQEFINKTGLRECNISEGKTTSYIYNIYMLWCHSNGILEFDKFGNKRWIEPGFADNPVKNVRQMGCCIKTLFPQFIEVRSQQRTKNLTFDNDELFHEIYNQLDYETKKKFLLT